MRTHVTFHTFVVLIAVLTVSAPFSAIAQQNAVRIEAETAAAQDANVVRLAAKAGTPQDASNDTNKRSTRMTAVCVGGAIGGLIGCLVGTALSSADPQPTLGFAPLLGFDERPIILGSIGCAVGALISLGVTHNSPSSPSPKRLLGKSPEYVEFYTDAYRTKTRSLRTKLAAAGSASAGGGMLIGFLTQVAK